MNTKSDDTVFENRMPVKHKSIIVMDKWTIIGAIVGGIWGLISLVLWILTSGGPTSSANPSIAFMILTLPASILILISSYLDEYGIIRISSTLLVFSIPIFGIVIGALISYIYKKWGKSK